MNVPRFLGALAGIGTGAVLAVLILWCGAGRPTRRDLQPLAALMCGLVLLAFGWSWVV